MLETLIQTSLACGATAADAVYFDSTELSLSCRNGKMEGLERSENTTVTLRCFVDERQAMVSSTDISLKSLKNLSQAAVDMAKIALPDPLSQMAPAHLYPATLPALDIYDHDEPTAAWLFERAQATEASALAVPGITNSEGADASYSRNHIGLMITGKDGQHFANSYQGSHASLSVSVLAGSGTDMQRDYDFSTARYRSDLKDPATLGKNAANRALQRLSPRKIKGGTLPVIYDRRTSRQLLAAFASAINGSSIVRGSSFLRGDMGKKIFSSGIRITDDPLMLRGLASKPFDGEGVATQKRDLVEEGILTSWVLDMRSSTALHTTTTGHASRGIGAPPSPSTTNLYMHPGTETPEALIKQVRNGLLITETFGTGINIVTGDYSQGAAGFLIENGEITTPVAEITIAGHLRDMFARMIPANDLVFDYATNAPSLYIEGMSVAGA